MFIKKGNRVYSDVYGFGTAITDENKIVGAIVKFDKENEHLFSTEDVYFTITGLTNDTHGAMLNLSGGWSFSGLFDYYTFADGTPFGVKKEE